MKTITHGNLVVIPRSEILAGDSIEKTIEKAAGIKRKFNTDSVGFMFNGCQVILSPDDILYIEADKRFIDDVVERYNHQMTLQHPYPVNQFD